MKEGWLYIMVECIRCATNMIIMISSQDGILLYIDNNYWYIYGVLLRYRFLPYRSLYSPQFLHHVYAYTHVNISVVFLKQSRL